MKDLKNMLEVLVYFQVCIRPTPTNLVEASFGKYTANGDRRNESVDFNKIVKKGKRYYFASALVTNADISVSVIGSRTEWSNL